MREATDDELVLDDGSVRLAIARTGATLRSMQVEGRELLWSSAPGELVGDGRGQVLAPFPNRLGDGRFVFGGREVAVPLNEPTRANAIHGLVRFLAFDLVVLERSRAVLATRVQPQPAWPWGLELEIAYALTATGCSLAWTARNPAGFPAPFGIGFHPYFDCGPGGADAASLSTGATSLLVVDDRGLPVGERPIKETDRARLVDGEATIGDLVLDDCLAGLERDQLGGVRVVLERGDGTTVKLGLDGAHRYLMVFSGDTLAPERRRRALALEPMTCPPDALRSARDLLVLAPGGSSTGGFSISASI